MVGGCMDWGLSRDELPLAELVWQHSGKQGHEKH